MLRIRIAMASCFCVLVAAVCATAADVKTIAGSGKAEYSGDGGTATAAGVGAPFGVSLGPDGALYVCEVSNHVIRRLDEKTGQLTTVAGSGKKGYAGDGGPATEAMLNEPYEVRFDTAGNLYFVEMQNQIVRKVDRSTGRISTVAGNGKKGFSGDGGPATDAEMSSPHSICFDNADNLYICDIGNHRIRKVDAVTGKISTFAGTGEKQPTPNGAPLEGTPLNGPRALDFDGKWSLYLALREGNAVYRIDLQSNKLFHLAGTGKSGYAGDGGPAKSALLSGPKGIAVGFDGDVYLADTESHTIRVIRKKTGVIETIAGDGQKGDGPDGDPLKCRMARPHGVFVDTLGNVYIGDSSNNKVRKLAADREERSDAGPIQWERWKLDGRFRAEGVAAADVNRDGQMDVLAGDVWYAAPDWKVNRIREPQRFVAGVGYSVCFASWAYDVNGDGWDDYVVVGFPGAPCFWYENPQGREELWKEHLVWHSACNETPLFTDVDGNGKPELVLGSQPEAQLGLLKLPPAGRASQKWDFIPVNETGDPNQNGTYKFFHGLGTGDINGDGRGDVVIPSGWSAAPEKGSDRPWQFHPWKLTVEGKERETPLKVANIIVDDLDLDGDTDLIASSAHSYGIWWFENLGESEGSLQFRTHLIDDSYSQTHALEYVDLDGDGQRDLVTGKRFFAHNGGDPGGLEPVGMYWYKVSLKRGAAPEFVRYEIVAARDTGIGTQFLVTDMNGDKKPDLVLANKKGVNVIIQK